MGSVVCDKCIYMCTCVDNGCQFMQRGASGLIDRPTHTRAHAHTHTQTHTHCVSLSHTPAHRIHTHTHAHTHTPLATIRLIFLADLLHSQNGFHFLFLHQCKVCVHEQNQSKVVFLLLALTLSCLVSSATSRLAISPE